MSKSVGKSVTRVDAYEKATGRAKYVADLCDQSALVARICLLYTSDAADD